MNQLPLQGQDIFLVGLILIIVAIVVFYLSKNKKFIFGSAAVAPALNNFAVDVTDLAKKGLLDPIVGRKKEIDQLTRILSRRTKNNVVLIGEAGIGKTSIAEGLAQNIAGKKVTPDLYNKRVLALNLNSLIAGTKYRGEFEERIKKITEEIENSKRSIILFVDEVHELLLAESSGESFSVGDILKPAMAKGDIQLIGATTLQEYNTYFDRDPAFKRRLQPIFVEEPNENETLEILRGVKEKYEAYHRVEITDEALRACVEKSKEMFPNRFFPDKAIDLMDETASKVKIEHSGNANRPAGENPKIKKEDVYGVADEYKNRQNI